MSDFDTLIPGACAFYAALDAENTRDWWAANKSRYEEECKAPALALLDRLQPRLADLTDHQLTTKLFRPHRDVRFSKDKTPYNTHLHMMWQLVADARQTPVYFFGIGLNYVTAGAGIMAFDKPVLADWRKFVDLDTDRVLGIVADLREGGYRLREPDLKRVPPPFPADHRAEELLRMKGVTASHELPEPGDLEAKLMSAFTDLWPLNALLLQVAEA